MNVDSKKILVIRLSSIGDVVLCSPVLRWLKTQLVDNELHFLCKKNFAEAIKANPHIDKLYFYPQDSRPLVAELRAERYDYIIDLHNNWRTWRLRRQLGGKIITFSKLNVKKWLLCTLKINLLPTIHLVDRYLYALRPLNIKNDGAGLDFFINYDELGELSEPNFLFQNYGLIPNQFIAIAIGAAHATKQIPAEKIAYLCANLSQKIVLLGGAKETESGKNIIKMVANQHFSAKIINLCGQLSLQSSAFIIQQAAWVIAPDTGLMHIAAALQKKLIAVWGSTVLDFGMYPYYPTDKKHLYHIIENKSVNCRPCSKLGYAACPKKHFDCMNKNDFEKIVGLINHH